MEPDRTLVTSYVEPDLDGYGGAFGYAELLRAQGVDAVAAVSGSPHDEVHFVLRDRSIPLLPPLDDPATFSRVILVDASEPNYIDPRIGVESVTEIIDHRAKHEAHRFPNATAQIELVGAAATLVAERFQRAGIIPSVAAATLLWGGILSNSVFFRNTATTERDREMASWLNAVAELPADYARAMFAAKSDLTGEKLQRRLESDYARFTIAGGKFVIFQVEIFGAAALVRNRHSDILATLTRTKELERADRVFATIVDIDDASNVFVTDDAWMQDLLARVLGVSFTGGVAHREGIIMRKQIVPLLTAALEHTPE